MKYVVEKSDLIGEIKNFTVELVQEMVDEQVRQGNNANVEVFQNQRRANKDESGFSWNESIKGLDYWIDVMRAANLFDSEQKGSKKKYEKMEYSNKIKLLENEVVHCNTEDEANLVLSIAHKLGYKWYSGFSFNERNNYMRFGCQTCYRITAGEYCYIDYYKEIGKTIISAEAFLLRHNITLSKESNVCKEVKERINNDPVENFKRIATIASVLIGKEITDKDCCKVMMAVKLVCEDDAPTLQTRIDICEYRNILDKMEK